MGPGQARGAKAGRSRLMKWLSPFRPRDGLLSELALARILHRPRYQPFFVKLAGHPFQVVDSLAFYWSYREIFGERLYWFPDPPTPPHILDCGANLGLASLFFLRRYPACRLTALEPDPDLFQILQKNLEPHRLPETQLLNVALAGQAGTYNFYQQGSDSGRLRHPFSDLATPPAKVRGIPLDDLLSQPVDFLKIDIEGGEVEVLSACKLLRRARYVFIEYHSFQGHPQELDVILSLLSREGFRYWLQNHFTPKKPWNFTEAIGGMDVQVNIFARRDPVADPDPVGFAGSR